MILFGFAFTAPAGAQTFAHFEARQVHPIAVSADGTRLFALNSPDGRLSIFDISNAANPEPVLLLEVPVGIEPVSVRVRTSDEVWVVNEVSDSISIVSLSRGAVVDTLRASDEPADVVFANGKAFVTCARSNLVRVFDATTRAELATIPLLGLYPRALAVSADGSRIYAAFLHSGNRTTVLTADQAPPQPAPTNPALPAAPDTGLIVPRTDSRVAFTVLDNDVVEINTSTHAIVRYFTGAGTNLFDIAVQPVTGDLWVPNTEALNLVRFEPVLRGHFANNRLTRLLVSNASATTYDLNPDVNYAELPSPGALATALAQPTAAVFAPDGSHVWVAAFGTDRVAKVSTTGTVLQRVDVRTPPVGGGDNGARRMRGPRGLARNAAGTRLYVLNKLANSISVIDTAAATVLAEVTAGSHDPMPIAIKEGRGFLFDARLSGNGTMSCATCHLDADVDGLAWDLGDPGGDMITVNGVNAAAHQTTLIPRHIHPMKGPLTTQTLRGMQSGAPFHWRGDRPTLQSFNPTYDKLMGGAQLATADINALRDYLLTLRHHPNPNRNLNNSMPALFQGGNPNTGRTIFNDILAGHCTDCHGGAAGSNNNLDDRRLTDSRDEVKTPPMRTVYQRIFMNRTAGSQNISGYGLLRDGTGPANFLPTVHFYDLDNMDGADFANVRAYVLCFETGTVPAAAYSRTVTSANATATAVIADMSALESQATSSLNDVVVQGIVGGKNRSFFYNRATLRYISDKAGEPVLTRNQLLALLGPNDVITFTGTLIGQGLRRGGDRDLNGTLDADEPPPAFGLAKASASLLRAWWADTPSGWTLEGGATPAGPFQIRLDPRTHLDGSTQVDFDPLGASSGFFRLRRTW